MNALPAPSLRHHMLDLVLRSEWVLELGYTAWDMQPSAVDVWSEPDGRGGTAAGAES